MNQSLLSTIEHGGWQPGRFARDLVELDDFLQSVESMGPIGNQLANATLSAIFSESFTTMEFRQPIIKLILDGEFHSQHMVELQKLAVGGFDAISCRFNYIVNISSLITQLSIEP